MTSERRRWLALAVVCLAQLMIVLDTTIVNVALPSIQHDLHFTQGNLTWVVNAFLVTFGSFLLLAGRLGRSTRPQARLPVRRDSVHARVVAVRRGLQSGMLIGARFIQGIGAAMQASVILAIIVIEFPEPADRARAMSAYVFTAVAGGSLGLLAGGVLTQLLSWHWIFFVNLPIGVAGNRRRPDADSRGHAGRTRRRRRLARLRACHTRDRHRRVFDRRGDQPRLGLGSGDRRRRVRGGPARAFFALEARIKNPIMPLRILRLRGLVGSCITRGFLVTGMYGTWFLGTLYLEHILHYDAIRTGLAFLPWTLTVAVLSMGITRWLVARLGALRVMVGGMLWSHSACSKCTASACTRITSRGSRSGSSCSASGLATRSCRC